MFQRIKRDIEVIFERDPAARNLLEVLLCYPGLHALLIHRFSHFFWNTLGLKLIARITAHIARFLTGIEIHPGAQIGTGFFIDHGMGVVIGETTIIGDNVTLYHGVTLGGTSWNSGKRHPTLEDGVVVGAGAKILGPFVVGKNARVGSNAVVVKPVPEGTTVVGVPGRLLQGMKAPVDEDNPLFPAYGQLDNVPDPVVKAVTCMLDQVHKMDRRVHKLEETTREPAEEKRDKAEVA